MVGEDEAKPSFLNDLAVSEFVLRFLRSDEGVQGIKEVAFKYKNQHVIID
jgi:hypothetical protein